MATDGKHKPDVVSAMVDALDGPREEIPSRFLGALKELFDDLQNVDSGDIQAMLNPSGFAGLFTAPFTTKLMKRVKVHTAEIVTDCLVRHGVTSETASSLATKISGGGGLDFEQVLIGMSGEWTTMLNATKDLCGEQLGAAATEVMAAKLSGLFLVSRDEVLQLLSEFTGKGSVFYEKAPQLLQNPDIEFVLEVMAEVLPTLGDKAVENLLIAANSILCETVAKFLLKSSVSEQATNAITQCLGRPLTKEALGHILAGDFGRGIQLIVAQLRGDDDGGFASVRSIMADEAITISCGVISVMFNMPQEFQPTLQSLFEALGFAEDKDGLIDAVLNPEELLAILSSRLATTVQNSEAAALHKLEGVGEYNVP
eukprot:SAG11_NODE_93_length_17080_cov_10.504093_17_plen_370_part_00